MKKFIVLTFLLLIPTLAFAQTQLVSGLNLTPPPTDVSISYLSAIFGIVDGVLQGTGSQLLGTLFGIYNGAVLVLAGIVFLYTFLVSTINTAHQGEVMGKDWSSIWIPLRSVAGIALLIPKASGYSFIQIFMIWIAVQGVGAADSIWNAALNFLYQGGVVIQQNSGALKQTNPALLSSSATLLRSLTCMEMLKQDFNNYRNQQIQNGASPLQPPPNFQTDVLNAISAAGTGGTVQFPTSNYYGTNGVCGSVTWTPITLTGMLASVSPQLAQELQSNTSRTIALSQLIQSLSPVARTIVANALSASPQPLGQVLTNTQTWGSPNAGQGYLISGSVLNDAAQTYTGLMQSVLNLINTNMKSPSFTNAWIQQAQQGGWALASMYYYNIINLNSEAKNQADGNPPTFSELPTDFTQTPGAYGYLGGPSSSYITQLQTLINTSSDTNDYTLGATSPFITGLGTYGGNLTNGNVSINNNGTINFGGGRIGPILGPLNGLIQFVTSLFIGLSPTSINNIYQAQATNANPILLVAQMGNGIVNHVWSTYISIALISMGITAGLSAIPFVSIGTAIVVLMISLISIIFPIMTALFVAGLTMTFYLPLIPFVIFTFGVIGWFIAVVEAVIAAPLVAMGLGNPEGHAILGKASPAVVQLVNVFLRPALMIFGLLIGMMISYVGVWLVNQGFVYAFVGASQEASSISNSLFKPLALLFLYVIIVMQVLQKSFSLIYIIPDEWAKWLGGNVKGFGGEAEAEKAIAGGVQAGAGKMGEVTGSLPEKGAEAGSKMKDVGAAVGSSVAGPEASGSTPPGGSTGGPPGGGSIGAGGGIPPV